MKVHISIGNVSMEQLCAWVGGELILHGLDHAPEITGICTDSREAGKGVMLCAIRGERTDGHIYLARAVGDGCDCLLCERIPEDLAGMNAPWAAVIVPDTVAALSRIAVGYREAHLPALATVGITGSVGKTSVKELCASVLSAGMPTYRREGNFNSVIGLPLSMLEIDPSYHRAVLEMGMSARGEISAMTGAVKPDIAVITNIGSSHLEHLGTRENIARAKLEILEGVCPGGWLLCPADEPLIDLVLPEKHRPDVHVLRVSMTDPKADVYAYVRTTGVDGTVFDLCLRSAPDTTVTLQQLFIPVPGSHMTYNAAVAAAVGLLAHLDAPAIAAGLAAYRPAALRQSVTEVSGVTLIEDCYNAAPESMRAALDVLDTLASRNPTGRRVAVLGDMRELGANTAALHRGVGAYCAAKGVDVLITVGALGAEIAAGAADAGLPEVCIMRLGADGQLPEPDAAADLIGTMLRPGDTELFKASRALQLERVSSLVGKRLARGNGETV